MKSFTFETYLRCMLKACKTKHTYNNDYPNYSLYNKNRKRKFCDIQYAHHGRFPGSVTFSTVSCTSYTVDNNHHTLHRGVQT